MDAPRVTVEAGQRRRDPYLPERVVVVVPPIGKYLSCRTWHVPTAGIVNVQTGRRTRIRVDALETWELVEPVAPVAPPEPDPPADMDPCGPCGCGACSDG